MSNKADTTSAENSGRRTLTPKLRFPEFLGAKEWEGALLGGLLEITSSKRVHESDWVAHGVPFYRAREVVALNNGEPITPLFISEELYIENAKKSGEVAAGDLLVTGVGSIGIPYLVNANDRFYFKDGNIIWPKNRDSKLLGYFLLLLYQSHFVQRQIKMMAGVGTVGTYTIDNANKTFVVFPFDKAEQQKIADCLSSVDELITAQARKVDALKAHKKGLMQQLFPQEGETQPRLRFPEFRGAGDWDCKVLDDICEVVNNRRRPIASNLRVPGPYPYYGASGIVDYVNGYIFDERMLLVGEDGAKWGAFEKTAFLAEGKYWVNNHAHVLQPTIVVDAFLVNFLTMIDLGPHVTGAAPPKLTLGKLKEIPVPVPRNRDEQQRIANCLSSLDDLIAAEGQKLDTLKTHKKGLMQQLFPQVGEDEA